MPRRLPTRFPLTWIVSVAVTFPPAVAQPNKAKTVTNLDGGVFMATDGGFPGSACFRVQGRMDAPEFFMNLKREDTTSGTLFRRGNDIVTTFPRQLELNLSISDFPCDPHLQKTGGRVYLTDEMIRTLRLSFYWKRGMDMRPAKGIEVKGMEVSPVPNYYQGAKDPPPQRYEWLLDFEVPSDGVPLTDSLVLVMRTPDHHIVARVAARL